MRLLPARAVKTQAKTLSENFCVNLERRRISPRIDLPTITVLEGDAPYERGYHSEEGGLLPSSQTTVEETQEVPAQKEDKEQAGWQTKSFRQSRRQRHLVRALDGMPVEGPPSRLVWGLLKRGPSTLPELEADGHLREAHEEDGPVLRKGAGWDRLEVAGYGLKALCGSFGRAENGKQSHRQRQIRSEDKPPGRRTGRSHLGSTHRSQPPRHKVSAMELLVSVVLKRAAHKEQSTCALTKPMTQMI
jgi:hypothetical protein